MKIKAVRLRRFKRFTDLTIEGLPPTARLIVLAGPNGCGKSSFFDALHIWHRLGWSRIPGSTWQEDYHAKQAEGPTLQWNQAIKVDFYDAEPSDANERKKAIYVRSAYRNDPEFRVDAMQRMRSALEEHRFHRIIDNDAAVGRNYQRLAAQGLEDLFENEDLTTTIGQYREKSIGEIRDSMLRMFPTLTLNSLGNPLVNGTFRFDKGQSQGFSYKNLSGGEKAAFDLVLDLIVKRREYDNTVFCIDEPEAHMSTRLQGALLEELYALASANSQLWLATHSICMMRRARDLERQNPETVFFIDFDGKDFDQIQTLRPIIPNRAFWKRALNVALDDLSELVAPRQIVICEGAPNVPGSGKNAGMDAKCYDHIFEGEFPDTRFLSAGDTASVRTDRLALMEAIKALVDGAEVIRLVDRDDRSAGEIVELAQEGVKVLSRRNLESYLFDDEVLRALCGWANKPEEADALIADKEAAVESALGGGVASDNLKPAAGAIYNAAKRRLQLIGCGSDAKAFMRDTLAALLRPGMGVYEELKRDIFH
jgi:AAA domain, putative AbiEii toxin, Type IV TA system/AAA domain